MNDAKRRLVVALDVPSVAEARELIAKLGDGVGVYKIGLEPVSYTHLTLPTTPYV